MHSSGPCKGAPEHILQAAEPPRVCRFHGVDALAKERSQTFAWIPIDASVRRELLAAASMVELPQLPISLRWLGVCSEEGQG